MLSSFSDLTGKVRFFIRLLSFLYKSFSFFQQALHSDKNEMAIAEQEYQEALQIYQELAVENPRSFLPNVAMTLLNLSIFYSQDQPEKSLALAQEVIEIAQQFPDLPTVQQYAETARAVLQTISKR